MPNTTARLALQEPLTTDAVTELRTAITNHAATLDPSVLYFTGTLSNRATVVSSPLIGYLYYATDTEQWFVYNGTLWRALGLTPASTSASTTAGDGQAVLVTGSSAVTITLPAHSSGQRVSVSNYSSGGTTVSGTSIQGVGLSAATSFPLGSLGATADLLDDGTNWNIIAGQQDSGWKSLSYGTNVSAAGFGYTPGARLVGDEIRLRGTLMVSSGNPNPWATIPSGVRPAQVVTAGYNATGAAYTSISAAGQITSTFSGATFLPLDSIRFPIT